MQGRVIPKRRSRATRGLSRVPCERSPFKDLLRMVPPSEWDLATSVNRLKDSKAKSKIIILLTDGVNNSGFIDPKIATELAVEFGIKTYTIGLGSNGTALAPIGILPNGNFKYGLTKVEIDEALLKDIAEETGGIYYQGDGQQKARGDLR